MRRSAFSPVSEGLAHFWKQLVSIVSIYISNATAYPMGNEFHGNGEIQ
jgi:hypothetical protein